MALLIDIAPLCECDTDHVLEGMHKSLSEPGSDDIWRPHESAYIRELIEMATRKGGDALASLKDELLHFLHRTRFGPPSPKPAVEGGMARWSTNLQGAAKAYLEGIPTDAWGASDYVLLVDYLAQKYLPESFAMQQADWLTKRASIMGKVQAMARDITPEAAAAMLTLWQNEKAMESALRMAGLRQAVLDYAAARCADHIVSLTDTLRHNLKRTLLEYEKRRLLGDKPDNSSLQQALLDHFGDLNRDWRRIALTEAGEMANQGFVATCKPGEKIKRIEQYANACAFCKKWDGKVLTVVSPDAKDKDCDAQVWEVKTNIGRSASPYKRVGGQLVKRDDSEMWKPSAGTFHPHCRGQWVRLGDVAKADEFSLWLDGFLETNRQKHQAASPSQAST